jgi:hypothetical protein
MVNWQRSDPTKVRRLKRRYRLLRNLITYFHPSLNNAPPLEAYLRALEMEASFKSFEEMTDFVDGQLAIALSNLSEMHPFKLNLKHRYQKLVSDLLPEVIIRVSHRPPFEDIMTFLAHARTAIAEEACDLPTVKFGLPRIPGRPNTSRTPFVKEGKYGRYLQAILNFVPEEAQHELVLPETISGITLQSPLGISLSTYLVCTEPPQDAGVNWLFGEGSRRKYPAATIVHTDPANLPIVKEHCRMLYEQILNKHSLSLLAELHWYLSHGMFYLRGSAAISEWLVVGLLGRSITWKHQPDLEALTCPDINKFVDRYPTFLSL